MRQTKWSLQKRVWIAVFFFCALAPVLKWTVAQAVAEDTQQAAAAPNVDGWLDYISSGISFADGNETKPDLIALESFLSGPGKAASPQDRKLLESAAARMRRLVAIQEQFAKCAQINSGAKTIVERVLSGARVYSRETCLTADESLEAPFATVRSVMDRIKGATPWAEKSEAVKAFTSGARMKARKNTARLMGQINGFDPKDVAASLNANLKPLSTELKRLTDVVNEKLKGRGFGAESEKYAKEQFELNGGTYRSLYQKLVTSPGGQLVLTQPLLDKIEMIHSGEDLRAVNIGHRDMRVTFGSHAEEVDAATVQKSIAQYRQELNDSFYKLDRGEQMGLNDLITKFPVSVGESLMTASPDDLDIVLERICSIAADEGRKQNMKAMLVKALDIGLAATTVFGGIGGLGLRYLGQQLLSRAVLAGTGAAALAADAVAVGQYAVGSADMEELLSLAKDNPDLLKNPDEIQSIEKELRSYHEVRRNAIVTGATSSIAALGALRLARLGAREAEGPADVLRAAKKDLQSAADEEDMMASIHQLLGEVSVCSI